MSVLKVKNGNQWDIVPAIKGDPGDPAADESITDDMLVTDGIKTEIEWLWGNQLTDSREGELLHAEDAYTAPAVDISLDGKSTQATTTGKNLLSDITDTWANYTIVQGIYKYVEIDVPPSTQLTVSPTSTAAIVGISGFNGYVVFWFDTTTFLNANIIYPINAGTPRVMTFTSGANGKLRVGLVNTMTQEALDMLWAKVKLQLEAGTTATDYEPYTGGKASPNPDYPQEIVSIDDLELYQLGNKENFYAAFEWLDGYYAANGDIVASSNSMYEADYIPVSPGDILTYLYKAPTRTAAWMRFQIYDSEKTRIRATTAEISAHNVEPEKLYILKRSISQSQAAYIRISINAYQNLSKPFMHVLTLQSTAPSLLPDGYSLRSLPDGTKDELHLSYLRPSKREGWAWYSRELVTRIQERVLNGSENWNVGSNKYNGNLGTDRYINLTGSLDLSTRAPNSVLSPVLKSKNDYIWANPDVHLWSICRNAIQVHIVFDNETVGISSSEEEGRTDKIKTWLSENPVTIYYPLATPTTETLDPIELPIMPSQTVNVWSDPATNLKMTYIQDSNLIIENLEATIADIATS